MSSTEPSAVDNHRLDKRYNLKPNLFPVIMSKSVHRKTSISKRDKLKQLDALAFSGANYNSFSAISFSPSFQSASQVNPDFFRKTKTNDSDDASLYSEVSAEGAGGLCPTMDVGVPFSPLSMLFEGILADSLLRQGVNDVCQDASPYPYSPASDHSRVASQQGPGVALARQENAQSNSNFSSPSTSSSTGLATPDLYPDDVSGDSIDQALAELMAQKALSEPKPRSCFEIAPLAPQDSLLLGSRFTPPTASRPPRRRPILTEVSEKQTGDDGGEGDDSYNLTMPGGGPLLEPPGGFASSFSPFWYSPPVSTQLTAPADPPTLKKEIQVNVIPPPPRPPRPEHCCVTLEDFGDDSSTICSPQASASPSLRAFRKTPAEYFHPHNRSSGSSSICIVDNVKTRELGDFKLAPAPSKGNRLVPDDRRKVDRSSAASMLSFVSAKSNLSTTKVPEYPTTEDFGRESTNKQVSASTATRSDVKQQATTRPPPSDRLYPPSASRAPPPEPIDLPEPEKVQLEIARKPTLVSKLPLSLRHGIKNKATPMGATDYSKQSSLGLSPYDTTVTPFPLSSPSSSSVHHRCGPSLPSVSPRQPIINLVHTTNPNPNSNRSTSLTTNHISFPSRPAIASSPCPPSTTLTRAGSRLRSYSSTSKLNSNTPSPQSLSPLLHSASSSPPTTTHKRTLSTTSHYLNNTTQQQPLLPRKSSLKRKPSNSSSSQISSSSSSSRTTRTQIVDSATSVVMSSRKVTFGEVQEITTRPDSQDHEVSWNKSHQEQQSEEKEEDRQVKELQRTASFKGFGLGTFHLGLSRGRRT